MMDEFSDASVSYIPRLTNREADWLAKARSGTLFSGKMDGKLGAIHRRALPSTAKRGWYVESRSILAEKDDWRIPVREFLEHPTTKAETKVRLFAIRFILLDD